MADLNSIDAEIKKLESLKTAKMSMLSVEKSINNALLYSTNMRKKYTDALSAAATVQRDLMDKEEKLASSIERTLDASKKAYKQVVKDRIARDRHLSSLKKLEKAGKKDSKAIKEHTEAVFNLDSAIKNGTDSINTYGESLREAYGEVDKLSGNADKIKRSFDALSKVDNKNIGSFEDLNKLTDQRIRLMRHQLNIQEKGGHISSDENKDLQEKLGHIEEMYSIQGDLIKRKVSDNLAPMVDELTKEASSKIDPKKFKKDSKKEMGRALYSAESQKGLSTRMSQLGNLKSLLSPKSSFGDKMASAKSARGAQADMQKLNDVMKVTGKSALGASGMMNMLGSALGSLGKLGWIGLILQAVTAVAGAVNELDKFIKGFNQTFAKLQGPTVMMKDAKKSMRDFSDSIFNLQRNLKYGLRSEEIIGMFQGIAESGMSLQGLLNKVQGGYGKMIEESAKVSLNFGVSVQEAGSMLGEQMTDLKASVDEASEGFKVLSYDASIAGIQSQKFYQATYAAAEALSYYGKFLGTASSTLKNFQQQGGMGFKDAQKQANDMTNMFKNMDKNSRVAFMSMSGGVESYRKDFIKLQEDSKASIAKHIEAIATKRKDVEEAKKRGDKETVDRISAEIKAEEDQLTVAEKTFAMASTAAKSNAQDMAMYLEMISDKVGEKMGDYFRTLKKQHGPDVFKDTRAMVEHMKAILPISDEFAMQMVGTIQTTREGLKRMSADVEELVSTLPRDKQSTFYKDIEKVIKRSTHQGVINMAEVQSGLDTYSKATGVDVSRIKDYLEKFPNATKELMEKGLGAFVKDIDDITLKEGKIVEKITGEKDAEAAKRLDDLVKGTNTIADFFGIQGDQLKYIAASSTPQQILTDAAIATARSTGGILDFMTGKWGTGREKSEKRLNEAVEKKLGSEIKELKYTQLKLQEEATSTKDKEKKESLLSQVSAIDKLVKEKGASGETVMNATIDAQKMFDKDKPVNVAPVKAEGDYKASTGGYALLSKGDVVVNAKNMSTGIGGDLGAFAGTAASEMVRSMGPSGASTKAAPTIPVQITIGSVSGDPEEFLKRIKPAIEQAFERMYFDKQKRK